MQKAYLLDPVRISEKQYDLAYLTLEAAVVVRALKPAVLLNLELTPSGLAAAQGYIKNYLGLMSRVMRERGGRRLLLICDPEALSRSLSDPLAARLLREAGYPEDGMEERLLHLEQRCRGEAFPHEIGLFLGYPPRDVETFISDRGQNCLLCGYWKVYHDVEDAVRRFEAFNQARGQVAERINGGMPFYKAIYA